MIRIDQSWNAKVFSSDIPDLKFHIGYERAKVTVEIVKSGSSQVAFEEQLYPDASGNIRVADFEALVMPWADRYTVFTLKASIEEQNVFTTNNVETVSVIDEELVMTRVVTCKARILNMSCSDFCNNRFLTLLDGPKLTAPGWKEVLSYVESDGATPSCSATYDDGSSRSFTVTVIFSGDFRMLDVSPDLFKSTGKQLLSYQISCGSRKQDFVVIHDYPEDIAPILLFANSFGVEEIAYCTGEHKQASSFDRKQSRFERTKVTYQVDEKETFKADTGVLTFPMANWWREVFRSKSVKLMTVYNGSVSLDDFIPVVLTNDKAELSNAPDHLPRYTFEYEYADRNHNIFDTRAEGRIFDNTFDSTFN